MNRAPAYAECRELVAKLGLGLSIVRQLIEMHRGWITIRNNEGSSGCAVKIVLPAALDTSN